MSRNMPSRGGRITVGALRRMHAKGLSDYAIAREFGVGGSSVRYARMCLGLPSNVQRGQGRRVLDDAAVAKAAQRGRTMRDIAALYGVSVSAVAYALKRWKDRTA